jgi:hypothetical protein
MVGEAEHEGARASRLDSRVAVSGSAAHAQQQDAQRAISQSAGDLYRFPNDFSVFLVAPEGVIAADPISAEAAAWLRDQIEQRFEQPIKDVASSHDHADHIS